MTGDELIAAGFKPFGPSRLDGWDRAYQFRVRDDRGTRYFINVHEWRHSKHGGGHPDGWEVELTFNDGCPWHGRAAVRVTAWSGVEAWTPADVLAWAAAVWDRLAPAYYDRDDAEG